MPTGEVLPLEKPGRQVLCYSRPEACHNVTASLITHFEQALLGRHGIELEHCCPHQLLSVLEEGPRQRLQPQTSQDLRKSLE